MRRRDGMSTGIDFAHTQEPFEEIRSIAVLRGGGLGDVLFAAPALAALRATYPQARITLLGTPLHRELLTGRFPAVDAVEVIPRVPGEHADDAADRDAVEALVERLAGQFDLGVQIHGGGRNSNPLLLRFGPRHTVGTRTKDAAPLERNLAYVYYQHEILRALEVVGLAGCRPVTLEPRITPSTQDRAAGDAWLRDLPRPVLVVHPGATDPRRRWPEPRFAEITARFVRAGGSAVVVGGSQDAQAAEQIAAGAAAEGAAGRVRCGTELTMSELVGILSGADVFAGNDSGPRHLAHALGTPTASVYWFGNLINAGPFERGRHRVQLSWTTHCPTCGRDATQVGWTAERCGHDDSFVADVEVGAVWDDVQMLTATTVRSRGR